MIPQMTNCFSAGRRAPRESPVSGVRRAHVVQRAIQAVLGLSGPAVWPGCPAPADRRACGATPGRPDLRASRDPRELPDLPDLKDPRDHRGRRDLRAAPEPQGLRD